MGPLLPLLSSSPLISLSLPALHSFVYALAKVVFRVTMPKAMSYICKANARSVARVSAASMRDGALVSVSVGPLSLHANITTTRYATREEYACNLGGNDVAQKTVASSKSPAPLRISLPSLRRLLFSLLLSFSSSFFLSFFFFCSGEPSKRRNWTLRPRRRGH